MAKAAIVLLNNRGIATAQRIKDGLEGAEIWGLMDRVAEADHTFETLGETVQGLYTDGTTIIGLCATGILIRALAPMLVNKRGEPPVIAVSDDGSVVVPLLGGLTGANELSRELAAMLGATSAITASGARAFGLQLEAPPKGYTLANSEDAKSVTSDLLAGKVARLEGAASWLEESGIPFGSDGNIILKVSARDEPAPPGGLLFHSRSIAIAIDDPSIGDRIAGILSANQLSPNSLAALIVREGQDLPVAFLQVAKTLGAEVCIAGPQDNLDALVGEAGKDVSCLEQAQDFSVFLSAEPLEVEKMGRPLGTLSIVGLGPGNPEGLTGEAMAALRAAEDLVGYETYVNLVPESVGPKRRHISGNRVELDRAREALDLAVKGRHVALVCSGDPGIFAMAAAVMEVLEDNPTGWTGLHIEIIPGVSAMQVAASRLGAPIGHDFCAVSLSDIRKPWDVIEARLDAVAKAGFVIALYNPASKTRREQVETARDIILRHRDANTPVILGRSLGRPGEETEVIELGSLTSDMVDMRTILIIGSSRGRTFRGPGGRLFAYAPRSHEDT